MDAGVGVKVESEDEVEPYAGTYACGFCSESVRGTAAIQCSQCSANPVHWVIDLTDLEAEGAGAAVGATQTGKGLSLIHI